MWGHMHTLPFLPQSLNSLLSLLKIQVCDGLASDSGKASQVVCLVESPLERRFAVLLFVRNEKTS